VTLEHPIGSPGPFPGTRWVGEFPCCPDREFYTDFATVEEAIALHRSIHHRERP
jgi:hypothetical protein